MLFCQNQFLKKKSSRNTECQIFQKCSVKQFGYRSDAIYFIDLMGLQTVCKEVSHIASSLLCKGSNSFCTLTARELIKIQLQVISETI